MIRQLCHLLTLAPVAHAVGIFVAGINNEALFEPYLSPGTEIADYTDANFSIVASA